jgi:glutamine amidotransferase
MIAIVKYNAGNIGSVTNALNRLGVANMVTDDPELLKNAHKVIFPGVGEAGTAMKYLRERGLDKVITNLKQPVLGICLGMQLMCNHSEEGDTKCLGIFDTAVKKFPASAGLKVPHMGWNSINSESRIQNLELVNGIKKDSDVYYVHSYYAAVCEHTVAVCDYILPFSSVLHKDNFYATQFHPEKSAQVGEQILRNFVGLP